MKTILPNTTYGTEEQIERWIKQERGVKLANRLNAIRLLMLGYKQREVARIYGVTRQCILKWVHKWNRCGKDGLISKSGGSRSKVPSKLRMEISKIIDVEKSIDGRVVTGKLICGYLKKNAK